MTQALQAQDIRLKNTFSSEMDFIWVDIKVWLHPFKFCCYQGYRQFWDSFRYFQEYTSTLLTNNAFALS